MNNLTKISAVSFVIALAALSGSEAAAAPTATVESRLARLTATIRDRESQRPAEAAPAQENLTARGWADGRRGSWVNGRRAGWADGRGGNWANINPWRNGWADRGGFFNYNPWRNGGFGNFRNF